MSTMLFYAILGLGAGGVYSMLASGLIVTHRGSGLINFAHGAIASFASFVYIGLRQNGQLRLPLPFPDSLHTIQEITLWNGPAPVGAAAALACLFGAGLSLLAYLLVFRPLRNAAPLAKVVGAIGVLIYLQGVIVFQYGAEALAARSVFPDHSITNFLGTGLSLPLDRIWLAVLATLIAVGLSIFYRRTRLGLVTRALAENEEGGQLLGWSPTLVALASWALTGVLAGAVGVAASPLVGVDPSGFTTLLVPALAPPSWPASRRRSRRSWWPSRSACSRRY